MAALDDERERVEKEKFEDKRNIVARMTDEGMDDTTIARILGFTIADISKYR